MAVYPTNARFFRVVGGLFFDYTAQAASPATNDIFFGSNGSPSTGDYFAIGYDIPFGRTRLDVFSAFDGVSEFAFEYWNGSAWTPLVNVFDETRGFSLTGVRAVSWSIPDDWAQNTVDGVPAYHMRILWSAWTSTVAAPKGSLITMGVDPVYGTNPISSVDNWNGSFRPPLIPDPEWVVWRQVFASMVDEFLESQWLVRWRRALTTAEGEQLRVRGVELNYLQPVGWTDERYRAVLIALMPASFGHPTTEVVAGLATALLDVGQSYTFTEYAPCSGRFTYLETTADDAVAYITALDRARARGCQYTLVAHPGGGGSPFVIGTSQIAGPDTLAELFEL